MMNSHAYLKRREAFCKCPICPAKVSDKDVKLEEELSHVPIEGDEYGSGD
jgi:hypothetical protein